MLIILTLGSNVGFMKTDVSYIGQAIYNDGVKKVVIILI